MPHSDLIEDPLVLLARAVGRSAGIDVTCTRDCEVLSDELRSFDGRYPISVSTLRRFFGLIPRKGNFSLTTLNSLARYVGYASYRQWQASLQNDNTVKSTAQDDSSGSANDAFHPPAGASLALEPQVQGSRPPRQWSDKEAKAQVAKFIARFSDPDQFHLTASQFARLREAVFHMYQRGSFDMGLWLAFIEHEHLLKFVVEQFPPLDFMSSFGKDMLATYLKCASTPSEKAFGLGVLAAGAVARDLPWDEVLSTLPAPSNLNPSVHPLVQSRNLGLWLLAGHDGAIPVQRVDEVRALILDGLKRDTDIWPRWAHQNCFFAFNLADWAVLSRDGEIVSAIHENISGFRSRMDWHQRDVGMDTLLSLRQMWNCIFLGEVNEAKQIADQLPWDEFLSMESRTLGIWYHSALWKLGVASPDVCQANIKHCTSLTGYVGFERRIVEELLQN